MYPSRPEKTAYPTCDSPRNSADGAANHRSWYHPDPRERSADNRTCSTAHGTEHAHASNNACNCCIAPIRFAATHQ